MATDPKIDKFIGLCRNFGDSAGDAEGGGTFGFGKTVYWNASRSGIVMFYSRFNLAARSGKNYARLIGGALFDPHEYQEHRYTGRAWLGEVSGANGGQYAAPITDKSAEASALVLGFAKRPNERRTGTSILIIDSHFSTRDHLIALRSGIEINYWPRIVDGQLVARLFDNDEELPPPAPQSDPHLMPFIDCYKSASAALGGAAPEPAAENHTETLKRYSQRLGALSLKTLATTSEGEITASPQNPQMNTVALLRKPRMVVEYYAAAQRPSVDYVGVFIADNELNPALAKSEPPTHNRWDASADELSGEERQLVRHLNTKLRDTVRQFLREQQKEEAERPSSCPDLGRELAKLLSVPGDTGTGPNPTPISITYLEEPHLVRGEDGNVRAEATVQVAVKPVSDRAEFGEDAAQAKILELEFTPRIVLDDGATRAESIGIDEIQLDPPGGEIKVKTSGLELPLGSRTLERKIRVLTGPRAHDEQTIEMEITASLRS
ncbi:MAG: hypothetical protein ACJ71U_07785 [Terriglobales bacterium]